MQWNECNVANKLVCNLIDVNIAADEYISENKFVV